jgi:hypothetical protein
MIFARSDCINVHYGESGRFCVKRA